MKRQGVWILAAVALLAALAGCDIFLAVPLVVTPLDQTVAVSGTTGGGMASWTVSGKGPTLVDYGDGATATLALEAEQEQAITHLYPFAGTYLVRFTYGRTITEARVIVTTVAPDVLRPEYDTRCYDTGEHIKFMIPRRQHSCNPVTGGYDLITGINPGEGVTEFRIVGYNPDGSQVSLFDDQGVEVSDQWIPLVENIKDLQIIHCWALYSGEGPLNPLGCDTGDGDENNGRIPPTAVVMHFTMEARNQYMKEPAAVSFLVFVLPKTCK